MLIEAEELAMAFIGDWGGLDGFDRAVPVSESNTSSGRTNTGQEQKLAFHATENREQVNSLVAGHKSNSFRYVPLVFLSEYDPRCDSVASLSTIASSSP